VCTQRGVPPGVVKLYTAISPPLPTSCKAQGLQSVDILILTASSVDRTGQAATAHVASICCHRKHTIFHDVTVFSPLSSAEQRRSVWGNPRQMQLPSSTLCQYIFMHTHLVPGHILGHNPNAAAKSLSVGKLNLVGLSCAQCAHVYCVLPIAALRMAAVWSRNEH